MNKARTRGSALLAAVLALMLALSCGAMWPLQRAYAVNENCTYSVSTTETSNVTVDAYQIFEGDVNSDNDAISNVAWGPFQSEVLDFLAKPISQTGASMPYGTWLYTKGFSTTDLTNVSMGSMTTANLAAFTSAENALAYVVDEINASAGVKGKSNPVTITAYGSFSNNMADYMHDNATPPTAQRTAVSGTPADFSNLREGFYLFYSTQDDDSFSPIWTPVDGTGRSGAVKNQDVLTVAKEVEDTDSGTWGKIADAGCGEQVTFRVTAQLPKRPATVKYNYVLHDKLSDGLSIYTTGPSGSQIPEMTVYAVDKTTGDSADVTAAFTATQPAGSKNEFVVECHDLYGVADNAGKSWVDTVKNAKAIIFEYKASVNVEAWQYEGTSYSNNEALLEYGADDDLFESTPDSAYVATYELDVLKVDSDTGKPVNGAKFKVSTWDANGDVKYLKSDSTLVDEDEAYEFVSGQGAYPDGTSAWKDGVVAVPIIDAGTYVVVEVESPAGYKPPALDTTTVVVTATKDVPNGAVTALTATADNGAKVNAKLGTGVVEIEIPNDPATILPITGMTPDQTGTVVGILLVAAGVAALVVRSRRKARGRA